MSTGPSRVGALGAKALVFATTRAQISSRQVRTGVNTQSLRYYANRTPLEQYDYNVSQNQIRSDEHQRKMLHGLNGVYESLKNYTPPKPNESGNKGLFGSMFGRFSKTEETLPGPKGIYMFGDVGCGKTMLMDMFYTTVPEHLTKRRIHFHGFMQDVHKRAYALKQQHGQKYDSTDQIALEVAQSANVLCLDEMQVTDVGDAMILRRLLQQLYKLGVVTFFTSNRMPIDLYKNGVQRELFVPTIHLIENQNQVVHLVSPTDYRSLPRPESGAYFFNDPAKSAEENAIAAKKHVDHWFDFFAKGDKTMIDHNLEIWGRPLRIPRSAGDKVMQFTFMELCGKPLSSADYLEMCETYPVAIVTDIPELSLDQRDLVRRFITFLDAAYDSHTKLVAAAEKPFNRLFHTKHLQIDRETNKVIATGESGDVMDLTNFAGHEEMFAFARAQSRLKHMSSEEWLNFER